ncbi:MAG: hypothetical protein ACOC34_06695, partial [Thermotogota bacterium]
MKKIFTIIVLFFVLISLLLATGTPKILVVYSYDSEYAWNSALDKSIRETLDKTDCEQRYFYMDTRLNNSPEWKVKAGSVALEIFEAFQPDVVIACDDNAVEFFATKLPESAGVPVVFCGMNHEPKTYGYPKPGVTGVVEKPFPVDSLDLCSEIVPHLKRVAFIGDETSSSDGNIEYIAQEDLGRYENSGFYKFNSIENLQLALENLQKIADAFYFMRTTSFTDESGSVLSTKELMEMVLATTDRPIIGLSDYIVYDGALCGVVPNPSFHGSVSANIALEIMYNNKQPSDFPIIFSETSLSDHKSKMKMINLDTATEKGFIVPSEMMNEVDILINSMGSEEKALEQYELAADSIFNDILGFMREVTSNEYAKNGDWERIKENFLRDAERKEKQYSALYIYIRPDGYFYSHVRNYTGVSLKDRAFFQTLQSGKEVRGYPIITPTVERKSVIFGMPVKKDGKLTGSIAISVFMDGINYQLNKKMNPENNTLLMAVNDDGTIMLNSREEYLLEGIEEFIASDPQDFMSVLNENDSGMIAFRHGFGEYIGTYKTNFLTGWKLIYAKKIFALADETEAVNSGEDGKLDNDKTEAAKMEKYLTGVFDVILQRINTFEDNLMETGAQFAKTATVPDDIESLLETFYAKNTDIYDISYINTDGIIEQLVPEERSRIEGADVSDHAVVKRVQETEEPVVSQLFKVIEGFYAINIEWPVFNTAGDMKGSLSLIFRPEQFFGEFIRESLNDTPFEVWLMQEDGTVIYDIDDEEIGENIFFDEMYD